MKSSRSSREHHHHHLDSGFAKKLAGLNSTQLSIESLSKWYEYRSSIRFLFLIHSSEISFYYLVYNYECEFGTIRNRGIFYALSLGISHRSLLTHGDCNFCRMIFNYKHAKSLVLTWDREFRRAHPDR